MSRWDDAATWAGEGLRREVFFFGPPGEALYGSLYGADAPTRSDGVLVCPSWGYEADRTERLAHHIALTAARAGGGGMVFHYPGYGDSHGPSLAEATLESLSGAAVAAIEEAARRRPDLEWFPTGLMLGAAVACLAQSLARPAATRLLLVQPELSPSAYFARLAKSAQRVTLGPGRIADMSFAYPLPGEILAAGDAVDASVRDALASFDGEGTILRCARPAWEQPGGQGFAELIVDATWRYGMKDYPELEKGVGEWLWT
jgi:hypothetical protein